jgi:hypothetical protein
MKDDLCSLLVAFVRKTMIYIYFADSIRISIKKDQQAREATTNNYRPTRWYKAQ